MYKKSMIFFAAAFVLAGCSTNKAEAPAEESSEAAVQSSQEMAQESSAESAVSESSVSSEEADTEEDSEDMAPVSEEEAANAEEATDLSQYEELAYAKDKVDLSKYESRILTDNQGKRVMLFSDGNQQVYKTVYVKHNNWLKVIDLKNDDLVVNESIK
ncbi:hypothetical protein [Carnobacterium sp.]|uniref:hypothetical protein n=1 Tax=Carnobacterium sp. TaxID=48221 RepID=UPI0028A63D8C|nr:hypothetical protein [Carnobacterium sp.]